MTGPRRRVRVCLEPGCPARGAWTRGRCPTHAREYDRGRGTRQERGYGAKHDRERSRIQARIDAGDPVTCWRCGVRLVGREWHLDHSSDRLSYRGPACVPCNLGLAGKARHLEREP